MFLVTNPGFLEKKTIFNKNYIELYSYKNSNPEYWLLERNPIFGEKKIETPVTSVNVLIEDANIFRLHLKNL